jgi:hypothetical protein
MPTNWSEALTAGLRDAAWGPDDLWLAAVGLGSDVGRRELREILGGEGALAAIQYDTLAAALNDRFLALGQDRPVPYSNVLPPW